MKQLVFILICLVFTANTMLAQGKPSVKFEVSNHNFGDIEEDAGDANFIFNLVNNGDAPLVISRVTVSCGCTKPEWTKEPIAAGGKGTVSVTYGAKGRPGPFEKQISVYTNDPAANPHILMIKGNVIPHKLSPVEAYPVGMGDLRLKQSVFRLGMITNTEKKTEAVEIFNTGTNPITLKYTNLPGYVSISTDPPAIPANSPGIMTIVYDATQVKAYGRNGGNIGIVVNNISKNTTENQIKVEATVVDNFSGVDLTKVPKIATLPGYVNFGEIGKIGNKTTQIVKVSNSGTVDLIIRSLKTTTSEVSVSAPKMTVKPGEIVELKLTLRTKKITRNVNDILEIITNDPNNPLTEIHYYIQQ